MSGKVWHQAYRRRFHRHYVACKRATDPVYDAVAGRLERSDLPLLDVGCGMGLLAFHLREGGYEGELVGVDYDERKIEEAQWVASECGFENMRFMTADARHGLPEHAGNVTILDILQFFERREQEIVLREAAARVVAGGSLIMRTGLRASHWRYRVTVAMDWVARGVRWMKGAPVCYPDREFIAGVLEDCGLVGRIEPLWGRTPFHNFIVHYRREA